MKLKNDWPKELFFHFSAVVLIFIVIEIVLHIVYPIIKPSANNREMKDKWYLLSPYEGKEWAIKSYEEFIELPMDYEQFLG